MWNLKKYLSNFNQQKLEVPYSLKSLFLGLIFIHRKFITLLDFGSCRFYPSCSQYAKISIQHNNLLKALYYVVKRLLKCNQYFIGGIDYPIVHRGILGKKRYAIRYKTHSKTNIQAWLVYTSSNKKELYWISNFT